MGTYKRLLQFAKPYKFQISLAILFNTLGGALNLQLMTLIKPVFDKVLGNPDKTEAFTYLKWLPLVILGVSLLQGLFNYLGDVFNNLVSNHIGADVRKRLFSHLLDLPLSFHNYQRGGELISRCTNDVNIMPAGISDVIGRVLKSGSRVIFLLVGIFYMNWKLALLVLIVFPVAIGPLMYFGKKMKKYSTVGQERMADLTSLLFEAFAGIRIIMAFGMEMAEKAEFGLAVDRYLKSVMKQVRVAALSSPVMDFIGSVGAALFIEIAGTMALNGALTTGTLLAMVAMTMSLYPEFKNVNGVNLTLQNAVAASERVFTILDTVPSIQDRASARQVKPVQKGIRFSNVSFSYVPSKPILTNISFNLKAGDLIALVGPSGAGKTTLVDLVPRFHDPKSGRILIDGVDLRRMTLASLRSQIGLVSQETFLFNDTIAANIGYGKPAAPLQEIEAAAKAANAHEFIRAQPEGYNTLIGERGVRLSGGQRQRLAIARAILKNPPILILDEATSSLDTQSERLVQEALDKLMRKRTTLAIAHRLSTVVHADKILVLEKGRVVEEGKHSQLIKKKGLYSKLYDMQFGKKSEKQN